MATNPEEEARRIIDDGRQEIDENVRAVSSSTQSAASSMGRASDDIAKANRDISSSISQAEAGFRSLGQSAVNFSRAVSQSDDSLSKYNGAIEAAGSGLSMLAVAAFGPLGVVLGIAIQAFSSLVGAQLKQTDKIVDNFNKLADLGAAAQFTSSELDGMFNQAGFNTFNGQSQIIVKTITSLGSDLTKLGATSADGIKAFTQLASFNTDIQAEQQKTKNEFANLGYSQEKLVNAQASFMKEQGALGLGRKAVDNKLVKQSLDYTKNLSMLSAITGETTETIAQSRKKDLEDFAFNASLRELGDDEAGQKQRKLIQNMATIIGTNVDETSKKAFMDVFANGQAISEEAQALAMRTNGAFVDWVRDFKSGKLSPEGFINKLNESGDAQMQAMAAAMKSMPDLRNAMGVGTKTIENMGRTMLEGQIEATDKGLKEKMKNVDPYTNFSNTVKNMTDQFAKMIDTLLKITFPLVEKAFTYLMKAVKELAIGFMNSPLAKDLGLNFDDLIKSMTEDEEVQKKQGQFLDAIERKQKDIDEASKLPAAGTGGQTDMTIASMKNEIDDLKKKLTVWQQTAKERNLPVYQSSKESLPVVPPKPSPASGPNTTSTQSGTMDNYKPRRQTQATTEQPVPQYKFGGITGPGIGDFSEKLTGGGIFEGPMSGYRKSLPKGKDFAVVPLPSGDTIPVTFKNEISTPTSMPADMTGNKYNSTEGISQLSDMMNEMITKFKQTDAEPSSTTTMGASTNNRKSTVTLESITSKLDTLLDRIRINNNLQTELLDHARG